MIEIQWIIVKAYLMIGLVVGVLFVMWPAPIWRKSFHDEMKRRLYPPGVNLFAIAALFVMMLLWPAIVWITFTTKRQQG